MRKAAGRGASPAGRTRRKGICTVPFGDGTAMLPMTLLPPERPLLMMPLAVILQALAQPARTASGAPAAMRLKAIIEHSYAFDAAAAMPSWRGVAPGAGELEIAGASRCAYHPAVAEKSNGGSDGIAQIHHRAGHSQGRHLRARSAARRRGEIERGAASARPRYPVG